MGDVVGQGVRPAAVGVHRQGAVVTGDRGAIGVDLDPVAVAVLYLIARQVIVAGAALELAAGGLAVAGGVTAGRLIRSAIQPRFLHAIGAIGGRRITVRAARVDGRRGVGRHRHGQGRGRGITVTVGEGVVDHRLAFEAIRRGKGDVAVAGEAHAALARIAQSGGGQGGTIGTLGVAGVITVVEHVVADRRVLGGAGSVGHRTRTIVTDGDSEVGRGGGITIAVHHPHTEGLGHAIVQTRFVLVVLTRAACQGVRPAAVGVHRQTAVVTGDRGAIGIDRDPVAVLVLHLVAHQVIVAGAALELAVGGLAVAGGVTARGLICTAIQPCFLHAIGAIGGRRIAVRATRVDGRCGVRRHRHGQGRGRGITVAVGEGVVDDRLTFEARRRGEGDIAIAGKAHAALARIAQSGGGQGGTIGTLGVAGAVVIIQHVVADRGVFAGAGGVGHGHGLGIEDVDVQTVGTAFTGSVGDHYLEAIDNTVIAGAMIRALRVLGIAIINGTIGKADDLKLALVGFYYHRIVGGSLCNIRPGDGRSADSCAGCQQHLA